MAASQYWIAQWLDENEIHSEWEIDHALSNRATVAGLVESVFQASQKIEAGEVEYPDPAELNDSILAGTRLDFSARLACPSYGCMRSRVDTTFKRAWHYFDQIVLQGLPTQMLAVELKSGNPDVFGHATSMIRDQMRLLLYIRAIGAERFVTFIPTSRERLPRGQWQQRAQDLGLTSIIGGSSHRIAIAKFIESCRFDVEEADSGVWRITIPAGQLAEVTSNFTLRRESAPAPEEVAHLMIDNLSLQMIYDVTLAQNLRLPLSESVNFSLMSKSHRDDSKCDAGEDAVVRVGLPVFDSLTTEDFLKLREDERPAFEIFRTELRTAIQGELAHDPSRPSAVIADSIQSKYLRPGLALIDQQVRSRRSALVRKTAVNLTIGTSVAAIGAIAGMPLLVESAAALGSSIPLAPIIHKYIDDGESIKMDKFYFLWQADKQSRAH